MRWAAFAAVTMLVANLGSTVAEFAGIGAALACSASRRRSAPLSRPWSWSLIARGSFGRVQYLFVAIGDLVSVAYFFSAILAQPDWAQAVHARRAAALVIAAYWLAVVGTVGTTITPWGQAFIQSYVADKRLRPEDLPASGSTSSSGALLTNVIAAFIVIACAATLCASGQHDDHDAAEAAQALGRSPAPSAAVLFAVGLLAASFLGLGVVPLTSAYTACEAFGWETGRRLALARGAGLLRPAGLLHRLRRALRADPGPAADPGDVPGPGAQRAAAAVHPGLRDAPGPRPRIMGDLVSGRILRAIGWSRRAC